MVKATYGPNPDTHTGPSPALWKNCKFGALSADQNEGFGFFEDFLGGNFAQAANVAETATTVGPNFRAYTGATAGSDIIADATAVGGHVTFECTTDNEGVAIRSAPCYRIAAGQGRLWFECRIKRLNVTDSKYNIFAGLMENVAVSTSVPITTSDAMADKNFVGFQGVFADGDQFDTTYKADGVTQVTVGADAVAVVADTYVKIGMYFDGSRLYFYKNGVQLADSKAISGTAGTDFPSDINLGVCIGMMAGDGADFSMNLDWVKVFQERGS